MNAKPEPGTVKQIAECANCMELLEKTRISRGWYHSHTGAVECAR